MNIEMISLGVSLIVAPFAVFALIRASKNQKEIERIEDKNTKGIERWGINSFQKQVGQNITGDQMSRTHKTNITTQRPNPPVKRQAMPSTSTHRQIQSRPVQHHHNDSPDVFRVIADMQDLSRYSSEPSTSYDSGSSYDSFGGGSSDGGGASSDW